MAKIELSNVTKQFADGTIAVRAASFTINDGEFFILVGPSGCGKSTLLHMIVGLEEVSSGEIRLDGKMINHLDPKDRNMAMVFQSYALYPHMSIRENIAFPLIMAKVPKKEMDKRVEEVAAILELSHLLDSKPRNLSGGQRQRVAMGRAIVRKPAAFLLDEPLSNLDARLRNQMRNELARLQKRLGTTTIYVTHDQTEAMTLGDRVAVLNNGIIQQIGTPYQLYQQPANLFVAGFVGSPAMNFFPGQIKGDHLFFFSLNLETNLPAHANFPNQLDDVIIGIRPEDFYVLANESEQIENQAIFDTQIDIVEWLGAELLIYFQIEINHWPDMPALAQNLNLDKKPGDMLEVTTRLDATYPIKEGDTIKLTFDINKLHFFDPRTGDQLASKLD
ncbi:sn-glycerol-3-phosphate ABC transporter ATP-binding protein UgpC [Nitrosomonas communis]|uniref:ABC transporter ATP-binding protein n=1 Tax=Nitrosomonas communis TaxID=44574 RepID=UPI0026F24627|nr:sn-glycerol-3-phosphate ABC transporter ATP-binding protein UgpC [Nitrosomonas communis]MCO6427269.1 sn-glycerol-3-phosphate ABC transporter ATP-binding protein UgpC [Nitrosomonas communis]